MVVKSKLKKKPKKTNQKQKQKQSQNVNQIVRIYLDERKKARKTNSRAPKQITRGSIPNVNIAPVFQNPINEMYPLQQPYNPLFYPRNPIQQPQPVNQPQPTPIPVGDLIDLNVEPTPPQPRPVPVLPIPPSSPVARRQPVIPLSPTNSIISSLTDPTYQTLIPPSINVPTNPLVAPRQPVNNFPNLQNDNADNILPFMDETNDEVSVADAQLPFMYETTDGVRLADFNDKNIGIIKTAEQDTIRIPAPDNVPSINRPVRVSLPSYTREPVEDQLAMDFNMGLEYGVEEPPAQIPLLPSMEAEDRGAEERINPDDLAIINRYNALRGNNTRGARPKTIQGYKNAIERMVKTKRNDPEIPMMEGRTRDETSTLTTTPFKTGISERERTPIGKSPAQQKQIGVGQAKKIGRKINLTSK